MVTGGITRRETRTYFCLFLPRSLNLSLLTHSLGLFPVCRPGKPARPLGQLSVASLFLLDNIISVSLPCPHACSHPVPPSEPRLWDLFLCVGGGSSLSLSGGQLKGPSICQSCACWNGPRVWQEGPRWLRSKNQDTNVVFAGVEMGPGRDTLSIQGGVHLLLVGGGLCP